MNINLLEKVEVNKVIFECLKASLYGPFFDEIEFHTLMGLYISEFKEIIEKWNFVDLKDENVLLAINNSINNLIYYPHGIKAEEWSKYISISREELRELFKQLNNDENNDYFKNIR